MRSDSRQVTCYRLSINPREDFDFVDLVQLTNFVFDLCDIHNGLSPPKSFSFVQRTSVAPILFSMGYHCFCVSLQRPWRHFTEQHPKITDAPVYGRWKSPNKDIAEIRKLRKSGLTLLSIAQRFGISGSAVSRICAGNRRARES
jgi:hypothetical protein